MDALDKLFVSKDDIKWELARAIAGRATIKNGRVEFISDELGVAERILVYYIGIKLIALNGKRPTAIVTPLEAAMNTGEKRNSVRPLMNKLTKHGYIKLLEYHGHGAYTLNLSALLRFEPFLDGHTTRLHQPT